MKKGLLVFALVFGISAMDHLPALACKAAGPDKHVGVVTGIDKEKKTFTILDAETQKELTFEADSHIIGKISLKTRIMITYKEDEGELIAIEVHS